MYLFCPCHRYAVHFSLVHESFSFDGVVEYDFEMQFSRKYLGEMYSSVTKKVKQPVFPSLLANLYCVEQGGRKANSASTRSANCMWQ